MTNPLKHAMVGLGAVVAFGSVPAVAQQTEWAGKMDTGLYLGGHVDYSSAQNLNITAPSGVWFSSIDKDKEDLGWKLYAGFPFYPGLAIELGYTRLGHFSFTGTSPALDTVSSTYRVLGYTADLVARLPLAYKFSLLGRIGGYFHETNPSLASSGAIVVNPVDTNDRRWSLKTGLGLQYDMTRNWSARAEVEQYNKLGPTKLNVDLFSLGVVYRLD